MWILLLLSSALAGELVVDARVPAELSIGGLPVARLYHPSVLRIEVEDGTTALTVVTDGAPKTLPIQLSATGEQWVLIGETGVTAEQRTPAPPPEADAGEVSFRVVGRDALTLRLDGKRHRIGPGEPFSVSLPVGEHPVQVRNADGTVIWASGVLDVRGGSLIVQVGAGRTPETTGNGGTWRASSR